MTPPPFRALVTGSRTWTDIPALASWLAGLWQIHPDLLVVHGDCPSGADAIADFWAWRFNVPVEAHPAGWRQHGRRAGYLRNAEMVDLGADICGAFIVNASQGATMCAELATSAEIPLLVVRRSIPGLPPPGWRRPRRPYQPYER